jgi:hypothetical protein
VQDRLFGLGVRVPGYRSRGPRFDSRRYQIFWEVVSLEQGPLSLVRITEELLRRNSSCSGLENREYGRGDPLRWPRDTLYQLKLVLNSPTRAGLAISIVRLRTKATEFVCLFVLVLQSARARSASPRSISHRRNDYSFLDYLTGLFQLLVYYRMG